MDLKGLLLAGAIPVVSAWSGAALGSGLHPAEPTGSARDLPYSSAFKNAVPLLDRTAPMPSYGPAPAGADPSGDPAPASRGRMPGMDHGAMNHGAMGHKTPSPSN